jgi:hypothetical protein
LDSKDEQIKTAKKSTKKETGSQIKHQIVENTQKPNSTLSQKASPVGKQSSHAQDILMKIKKLTKGRIPKK